MLSGQVRSLLKVVGQFCKIQTGQKAKLKSCFFHSFQFNFIYTWLPSVNVQSSLWIRPSVNVAIGNAKMPLQKMCFQDFILKRNRGNTSGVKRKPAEVGWLLAGCCFSKKSRKDSVGTDVPGICIATENSPNTSYDEPSETQVLLPAEKTTGTLVTDARLRISVEEIACNDNDVSKNEESTLLFKDSLPKEEEDILKIKDDHERSKDGKEKLKKPRPNYFVAIQVDNPKIHESLKSVQDSLLEHKPLLKNALISISTLHITFVVMRIEEEIELERAKDALVACYENIKEYLKDTPLVLTFEGLSHFRNQVLFAELKIDESYMKVLTLYDKIASSFELHGFDVREKKDFTPHLTVAKLSKDPKLYRKGVKRISPAWYEGFENNIFGEQVVKSLQLLEMAKSEDGYYPCDKECFFDFSSSETKVPLEQKLLSVSLGKKEVRKKIRDMTNEKLGLSEQS